MSIQLLQGDCLELMKDIPDGSVDMVLADPPFGTTRNKWDVVIPFPRCGSNTNEFVRRTLLSSCFRKCHSRRRRLCQTRECSAMSGFMKKQKLAVF